MGLRHAPLNNLYRILGVRPGADDNKIKAAYWTLAKRFHPDRNGGDQRAEQITKQINGAYQTLGDPAARAAYDLALARERIGARRRFLKSMATGAAAFLLPAASLALIALWKESPPLRQADRAVAARTAGSEGRPEHGELRRKVEELAKSAPQQAPSLAAPPDGRREGPQGEELAAAATRIKRAAHAYKGSAPAGVEGAAAKSGEPEAAGHRGNAKAGPNDGSAAPSAMASPSQRNRARPASWTQYYNAQLGFALSYPAEVFSSSNHWVGSRDHLFLSGDGRALLRISSQPIAATDTLAQYRGSLMAERYRDATFNYAPLSSNGFVLAGSVGDEMFYERVTLSCRRHWIHGWLLVYPLAQRPFFEAIAEEIDRSYRHPDRDGRCADREPEGPPLAKRNAGAEAVQFE